MLSVLAATITVKHSSYVFQVDDHGSPVNDPRGNQTGGLSDPVDRLVIGIYDAGYARVDPISVAFQGRTIADRMMLVPSSDVNLYKKLDRVLVSDGNQWLSYEVQNQPFPWSSGFPWAKYRKMLAGEVHIRRVD